MVEDRTTALMKKQSEFAKRLREIKPDAIDSFAVSQESDREYIVSWIRTWIQKIEEGYFILYKL